MNCNVCGAEIPAGATNCPVCGAQVSGGQPDYGAQNYVDQAANQAVNQGQSAYSMAGGNPQTTNPFGAMQNPQQNADPFAAQQGGYDPYGGGGMNQGNSPFPVAQPPKKSNTGLIIGIVAGVVVIAAVVICLVLGVFGGKGGTDGTYKFKKMLYGGMEIDNSMLSEYGLDLGEFSIEIKGDKATVVFYGESAEADVKIDGENITFTSSNGQVLSGTIKSGEITISESGGQIVLAK